MIESLQSMQVFFVLLSRRQKRLSVSRRYQESTRSFEASSQEFRLSQFNFSLLMDVWGYMRGWVLSEPRLLGLRLLEDP